MSRSVATTVKHPNVLIQTAERAFAASFDVGQAIGLARDQQVKRFTQIGVQTAVRQRGAYRINVYVVNTCLGFG